MRPEYLEALAAARWNYWFIAMWIVPALVICFASRTWLGGFVGLVVAIIVCWLCLALGTEYYWDVKMQMAETDLERADATADTARLFGPLLIGTPFAVIYCTAWLIAANVARRTYRRVASIAT